MAFFSALNINKKGLIKCVSSDEQSMDYPILPPKDSNIYDWGDETAKKTFEINFNKLFTHKLPVEFAIQYNQYTFLITALLIDDNTLASCWKNTTPNKPNEEIYSNLSVVKSKYNNPIGVDLTHTNAPFFIDETTADYSEVDFDLVETIIQNSHTPLSIIKKDGTFKVFNQAALEMFGYTKEEHAKLSIIEMNEAMNETTWQNHWQELSKKRSLTFTTEIKKKDGKKLPVEIAANMVFYQGEEMNFTFVKAKDKIDQLEKELNIFREAFKKSIVPKHYLTKEGNVYDFNDAACKLLGYTAEEFSKLTIKDLSLNHTPESWLLRWEASKKGVKPYYAKLKKKDNTLIDVEIRTEILVYQDQELSYTIYNDITEKMKLDYQLNLVDFAFKTAAIPMYFLNELGIVYEYNECICTTLGYTTEEFKNLTLFDISTRHTTESWKTRWHDLASGNTAPVITKLKKKNGELIDVELRSNLFIYNGLKLTFTSFVDITDKIKLDNQLIEQKVFYEEILDCLPNDIAVLDKELRYRYVNPKAISNPDLRKWIIGKTDEEYIAYRQKNTEIIKERKVAYLDTLANNTKKTWEETIVDQTGKINYIYRAIYPITDEHNKAKMIIGYAIDVNDIHAATDRARLFEFGFKNASIPAMMFEKDGSIYDFNNAMSLLVGYTSDELKTIKINEIDVLQTIDEREQFRKSLREKRSLTGYKKIKTKEGKWIDVECKFECLDYEGKEINYVFLTDITEKKRIEEQLHLIDSSFRKSPVPMSLILNDGSFYDFNEATNQLLGYTRAEYKNLTIPDINPLFDLEKWKSRWQDIKLEGGVPYYTRLKKKNGDFVDVEVRANIIRYGALEFNCATYIDITTRLKNEKLIQKSIERYQHATIATSDVVWEADLINNEVYISKNFTTFFGHPVQDGMMPIENNIWRKNIHPDDVVRVLKDQYGTAQTNKWVGEYRLKKADGSYAIIQDRSFTLKDKEGKMIGMFGAMQDVTEKKTEESRMRLLESVIINTKDCVVITETGSTNPKILFVNKAFTDLTGYGTEEVIGMTPKILQSEKSDKKELEKLRIAMTKWEACEITVLNRKKNGEDYWANIRITPLANENGWYTHWIALQQDVTKEKLAEQEKEKLLEELVQNNKELKQFSYITTHNLRAPLTNLVSICKLIKIDTIEDQRTVKLIEGFKSSTQLLNETLNDLLNILIIKENINLPSDTVNFDALLGKVRSLIYMDLIEKGATIDIDFSEAESVEFSAPYMESILLNLITNAIKYRHPERLPYIKIKTKKGPNGKTILTFSDNGIGMDMEVVKDKIFGLYKRFHKNADSKGIGLFLTHSQITSLGGTINCDSAVNVGTTFTITFR